MYFVREPGNLFFYRSPNNHVLHTLLVKISVALFGDPPAVIRLPAFISGVLVIPAVFYLSRIITGNPKSGYLSAAATAVFPYMVLFGTNARGYSLLVLLSILLAALALCFLELPSKRLSFLIAFVIALGMLVMPSFLFPAAGIMAWLACLLFMKERSLPEVFKHYATRIIPAAVALVLIFYLPVIIHSRGIYNITSNIYVRSVPFSDFASFLPCHFKNTAADFSRDVHPFFVFTGFLLAVFGSAVSFKKRRFEPVVLLPALAGGGAAVLFAFRAVPFSRTWIYFIPFTLIAADTGFSFLPGIGKKTMGAFSILLLFVCGLFLVSRNAVSGYPDTGHFPEALVIAKIITENIEEGDAIAAGTPADAPLQYYLRRSGIPFRDILLAGTEPSRIFFVVKPSVYSLSDISGEGAEKLAEFKDAGLYLLEKR